MKPQAETKFKQTVSFYLGQRIIPGPTLLNEAIHGHRHTNVLNGRETRWRREVFEEYGLRKDEATGRWHFA